MTWTRILGVLLALPFPACGGRSVPPPYMIPVSDTGEPSGCTEIGPVEVATRHWASIEQGESITIRQMRKVAAAMGANYVRVEVFDWTPMNKHRKFLARGTALKCREGSDRHALRPPGFASIGPSDCAMRYDCGAGESCGTADGFSFSCSKSGAGKEGDSCNPNGSLPLQCGDRMVCLGIAGVGHCRYWCGSDNPCPSGTGSCKLIHTTKGAALSFCIK